MKRKVALVTGITGQDGVYLTKFLLEKDYIVHGLKRHSTSSNIFQADFLCNSLSQNNPSLILHFGDLTDTRKLHQIINDVLPDEIYNLAAQSHVAVSFDTPEYTANVNAVGTLKLLETIRLSKVADSVRFYQASTSELFGDSAVDFQDEKTPFRPRSPYGVAKLFAYWTTVNYRDSYNIFASNGILFNHESPLRGENFVTRKITRGVASIHHKLCSKIYLGNLDAERDWGHARDYAEGMWKILQHSKPDDFVLSTGTSHSVREFVVYAFSCIDRSIFWKGIGENEVGIDEKTGEILVAIDPTLYRPFDVGHLKGNSTKAKNDLGWKPTITFPEIVREMVEADLKRLPLELNFQVFL